MNFIMNDDVVVETIDGEQVVELKTVLGGDEIVHQVPLSELRPIATDDRFKVALRSLGQDAAGPRWGAPWRPAARSREEFIANAGALPYVRGLVAPGWDSGDLMNPNLMAFENDGGLFNGGVCWWHSRFQRAAIYLTYYLPDQPRPDRAEARRMISHLMAANAVVPIPGYRNFYDFSWDHKDDIQSQLERTELLEALFEFSWVNGLAGRSETSADHMKKLMDDIHREVADNGLAYVKLQSPGVDAHAWIVTEMEATEGGGYRYKFIDSNSPWSTNMWFYKPGDRKISMFGNDVGVAYLQRSWELRRMKRLIARFAESPSPA